MKSVRNIILMILTVIIWCVGTFWGLPKMINSIYDGWYGMEKAWLLTGNLSVLHIILAMLFFAICVWLYSPFGLLANVFTGEEGLKAKFPLNIKIIITVISFVVVMMGSLFSVLWHDVFTKDGVQAYHFGVKREYSWEDAKEFRLKSDYNGVLIFEVTMEDGRNYYFNGGFFRAIEYTSESFDKEFLENGDEYIIYLAKKMAEYQVKMDVSDWEDVMDDFGADSFWIELSEEIRENYEETAKRIENAS